MERENVYLVGLMGSGKTTLGRILARHLDVEFLDSDHEIERRAGASIPALFEAEGEAGFRQRESEVIAGLAELRGKVIATGGGVVLRAENRACLAASGFVVYLNVPLAILVERTHHDRNRPLLQVADPMRRLSEIHAERDPLYREVAHLVIDGGRGNPQRLVQRLLDAVAARWAVDDPARAAIALNASASAGGLDPSVRE